MHLVRNSLFIVLVYLMSPFLYNVHVYEGEVVSADNTAVFSGEDELNKGVELTITIKVLN